MVFHKLPVDIQIEILKYNPYFRSVNKIIHQLGRHAFEKNTFIRIQPHYFRSEVNN